MHKRRAVDKPCSRRPATTFLTPQREVHPPSRLSATETCGCQANTDVRKPARKPMRRSRNWGEKDGPRVTRPPAMTVAQRQSAHSLRRCMLAIQVAVELALPEHLAFVAETRSKGAPSSPVSGSLCPPQSHAHIPSAASTSERPPTETSLVAQFCRRVSVPIAGKTRHAQAPRGAEAGCAPRWKETWKIAKVHVARPLSNP